MPDESIWHNPERLEEWFEAVKQRRESGLEPVEQAEDAEMTGNELTREYLGGT